MADKWMPKKPNFGPPPAGYIAGLGRGATGFVTKGRFDTFEGQKQQQPINRQKQQQQQQQKPIQQEHITSKFIDLKRDLAKMSNQDWEAIPDCIDLSVKKRKRENFIAAPDSVLTGFMSSNQVSKTIQNQQNLQDFRDAKETLLKSKLDNAQNRVKGIQAVDKIGYITQLDMKKVDAQFFGDIKKARQLMKSALISNPKNHTIWLSLARVEEQDGQIKQCREVLRKALLQLPLCEDLWIELSRVEHPQMAKQVLIEGLRYLPKSQKLWIYAAERQGNNKEMASKILRKGLQNIQDSVQLWKALIDLQPPEQGKSLLYQAVKCLPHQVQLWLALAKLQDYEKAKSVLNKARKCNPLNSAIWISGARLQQAHAKIEPNPKIKQKIQQILVKARQILKKNGATISRQEWLQQALAAQFSQSYLVCEVLVKISVGYKLSEQQIMNVLTKDVMMYQNEKQSNYTTRFLYRYGVLATKSKKLMQLFLQFENRKKNKKQYNRLQQTLYFALELFQQDYLYWKLVINKFIADKQYQAALQMIETAEKKLNNENKQAIQLLKIKIYYFEQNYNKARQELKMLRQKYPKGQSIYQSIRFQYQIGNFRQAWQLCQKYFKDSSNSKIWRLAVKIRKQIGNYQEVLTIISKAVQWFPESLQLWLDYLDYQVKLKHSGQARAVLQKAMIKLPQSQQLAVQSILLQIQLGCLKQASFALSKALKNFPKNAQIWGLAIDLQPNNTKKKKASIAEKTVGLNTFICNSIAKLFWKEGINEKVKRWFQQSLKCNSNYADTWAYYLLFLQKFYPESQKQAWKQFSDNQQELQGRVWKQIKQRQGGWGLNSQQILKRVIQKLSKQSKNVF